MQNLLQQELDALHNELEKLSEKIQANGYYIKDGKVFSDHEVTALFWKITQLGDDTGDGILLCYYSQGAKEVSKEAIQAALVDAQKGDFASIRNLINKATSLPHTATILDETFDAFENAFSDGRATITLDNDIVFSCDLDSDDVGEWTLTDGSYFQFRKTKLSEIDQVEHEFTHTTYNL